MKNFKRTIMSAVIFMGVGSAFAFSDQQNPCPAPSVISANASFIKAMQSQQDPSVWGLISRSFNVDGRDWQTWLGVILPDVNSQSDALQQGQEYFNNNVVLQEGTYAGDQQFAMCLYTSLQQQSEYLVAAFSPAIFDQQQVLAKFAHQLKR